ncbi:hypothetical protein F4778DRAFT_384075 [Xylariomycetidae sp. FL2044]|nr:hypothetical protein F4778DRAFT_384075 [Xylariomycetidae sp. FL2044]
MSSFSKMAIIAAPTKEPSSIAQHHSLHAIDFLEPISRLFLSCQRVFARALLVSLFHICSGISYLIEKGRIIALHAYIISSAASCHLKASLSQVVRAAWNSQRTRRLRKKLEYEFFTLILGSVGNNLCLLLFWPGWYIIVLSGIVVRMYAAA